MREDVGGRRPDSRRVGSPMRSVVNDSVPSSSDLGRVLIVDADSDFVTTIGEVLRDQGYDATGYVSGIEAFDALNERDFDVIVADERLPDINGVSLLRRIRESHPAIVGILMTESAPPSAIAELMRNSAAFDCLSKPFTAAALVPILDRAVEVGYLRKENQQLRESLSIYELANASVTSSDVPRILGEIAKTALRQVDADEVSILLPTADGSALEVAAAHGPNADRLVGRRVAIDDGVVGWVARHRDRLVIRGGAAGRFAALDPHGESSITVLFPMLFAKKLVGVVSVGTVRGQRPFTPGQIESLGVLADVAASVVQTASLYAQAREAEQKYRTIFENAIEGIYQSTASGKFLSANPSLAQMFGYATPEALMLDVTDIGRQLYVDPERRAELHRRLNEGSAVRGFVSQMRRRDGQVIWVSESARLVGGGLDGQVYCEGAVEDITTRKVAEIEWERSAVALRESHRNLEDALARVKKMHLQVIQQERLSALGQMANGVAHDFNNDLAMIVGFSELLLKRSENLANPEKVRSYLQMIRAVAGDAAKVVDRLREFSRHRDEGEVFVPVNLNELVDQCILLTQPRWRNQAQAAGVTIQIETDLHPLPNVSGNASDLRDALTSLIFNAVDAMPEGGTLTFRTRLEGQRARLEVIDTGTGMSDEVRQHCFEPFFTTKGERGTGLGLSLVYGTIQRHDGSIEIQTTAGQGTTISVQLPLATTAAEIPAPDPVPAPIEDPAAPRRVLLVEDEAPLRRILTEFLSIERHVVETAANGREGLEKFLTNVSLEDSSAHFNLVVTDLAMPEMSGDQLAVGIKNAKPDVPIILLTGLGEMLRASGEKPVGVDLVLAKPVSMATLQRAVVQVTSGRMQSTPSTNLGDAGLDG